MSSKLSARVDKMLEVSSTFQQKTSVIVEKAIDGAMNSLSKSLEKRDREYREGFKKAADQGEGIHGLGCKFLWSE
jgi:hypothetical protein